MSSERRKFFKKLRDEHYTLLIPDMCPIHFELLSAVIESYGYHVEVVNPVGREAKDDGLRTVHNDACYPVIVTCGAFVNALKSGKYDLNKTAILMSQTGGGCRASNYISLFRKAFAQEFPMVPVISMNFSGLEKDRSLPTPLSFILRAFAAVEYGDMIMAMVNQSRPYEKRPGEINEIRDRVIAHLKEQVPHASKFMRMKKNLRYIADSFADHYPPETRKPRVAIVGEIFVKYSPYANNHLQDFLEKQGCEVVYPGLSEFLLYCMYNIMVDHDWYGINSPLYTWADRQLYRYCNRKLRLMNELLKEKKFTPFEDFSFIVKEGKRMISPGVKMGEGWVIPAEMLAYSDSGVKNIVCVQPFGCLPNHIVGKGMIRPLKKLSPDVNVVPLDFDASSTEVNQENRLKLMLANAK